MLMNETDEISILLLFHPLFMYRLILNVIVCAKIKTTFSGPDISSSTLTSSTLIFAKTVASYKLNISFENSKFLY